jgi:hypothetical protein
MQRFWVHVNHPNNKARIHADDGCAFTRRAAERVRTGEAYGPELGDRNGYWKCFDTLANAQTHQRSTGKKIQDRCRLGPCQARFS